MGQMKDLYTQLQEQGIDPSSVPMDVPIMDTIQDMPKDLADTLKNTFSKRFYGTDNPAVANWQANEAQFAQDVYKQFMDAKDILIAKHRDYGPKNISQSPGGALNGLRVRMHDKLARINHLLDSGAAPENESLKDSFLDLANYAIIGMMVLDGQWPTE